MLQLPRTVRAISQEIADAANGAWKDYRSGDAGYEPDLTGRIVGAIRDRLRSKQIGGITWNARSLRTGRGRGSEESRHGADLLGVLDIKIEDYQTTKGFLAQAKRVEPGKPLNQQRWDELVDQCHIMLRRTPDAYVFAYSKSRGIRIIPANSIVSLDGPADVFRLFNRGVASFFEIHIESYVGDPRLNSTDIKTLDALVDLPVQHVMQLSARIT